MWRLVLIFTGSAEECPEWNYFEDSPFGPQHWAKLCPEWAECGSILQSPVDIVTDDVVVSADDPLVIEYYDAERAVILTNEGHTLEGHAVHISPTDANELYLTGAKNALSGGLAELYQFHMHSPSEHTINGEHYPLEMHFVHKTNGGLVVMGVFVLEGEQFSPFLDVWDRALALIPFKGNETLVTIDLLEGIPTNWDFYTYVGSLTTPPCAGPVKWILLKTPIYGLPEQVEALAQYLDEDNRPLQPLAGRRIKLSMARTPSPSTPLVVYTEVSKMFITVFLVIVVLLGAGLVGAVVRWRWLAKEYSRQTKAMAELSVQFALIGTVSSIRFPEMSTASQLNISQARVQDVSSPAQLDSSSQSDDEIPLTLAPPKPPKGSGVATLTAEAVAARSAAR